MPERAPREELRRYHLIEIDESGERLAWEANAIALVIAHARTTYPNLARFVVRDTETGTSRALPDLIDAEANR